MRSNPLYSITPVQTEWKFILLLKHQSRSTSGSTARSVLTDWISGLWGGEATCCTTESTTRLKKKNLNLQVNMLMVKQNSVLLLGNLPARVDTGAFLQLQFVYTFAASSPPKKEQFLRCWGRQILTLWDGRLRNQPCYTFNGKVSPTLWRPISFYPSPRRILECRQNPRVFVDYVMRVI